MTRSVRIYLLLPMLVTLVAGCAGLSQRLDPPRISLVNITSVDIQMLEQRYGLTLRIQNPNDRPLDIQGVSFDLDINHSPFAHGVSNRPVSVPAFGEATLELEVSSNLLRVIAQLQQLERDRDRGIHYRIKGKVSLSGSLISIPFEEHGEINLAPEVGRT